MHLSVFYRRVLTVRSSGFECSEGRFSASALHSIRVWQEPWPGFGHVPDAKLLPRARITFQAGKSVLLRGDALVKRGRPLLAGYASAFDELVSYLLAVRLQNVRGAVT